jgi:hypothetical protein
MTLRGNGQLLLRTGAVTATPAAAIAPMAARGTLLPGYTVELLSPHSLTPPVVAAMAMAGASVPAGQWLLARPATPGHDTSPWDTAHAAARSIGYTHFVEPDILHENDLPPAGELDGGLNTNWRPKPEIDGTKISPCWHLETAWTGFADVRGKATGAGIRIAHLDTGYSPTHVSRPRHLRPDLGWDYWENKSDPVDPGTPGALLMPGHGTATLALLAGAAMDLPFLNGRYLGDVGGAPDAEVVPVRISPSVVHLATSTMAQGLYHAMAPGGDPTHPNPANRCDVVSLSHGGLPSPAWADAVNTLYDAGSVIAAASGDSIFLDLVDLATRYTVYPSAFNRVVNVLGATYDKRPYITQVIGALQGCWGPDLVMEKAIAAFTPNVVWMKYGTPDGFEMSGGGTSSSTPQVAAACALWLQLYGNKLVPADWRRVEAVRLALWKSATENARDRSELGWGLLNVPAMLDETLAQAAVDEVIKAGEKAKSARDSVSIPLLRLLLGLAPPDSEQERMYEAEVAQLVAATKNPDLSRAARTAVAAAGASAPSAADRAGFRDMLAAEGASVALKERLAKE